MDSTLTRRLRGDGLRVLLHLLDGGAADFVIERLGFVIEVYLSYCYFMLMFLNMYFLIFSLF